MQQHSLTWPIVDREAEAMGVTTETRRKWRQANRRVPFEWRLRIIESLAGQGLAISAADFDCLNTERSAA